MIWQLVTIVCGSVLGGEAWITLRDRARARHAGPEQPKHTFADWLARKPVDLDQHDRRGH